MERINMQEIADKFDLGNIQEQEGLMDGLVNDSHRVTSDKGIFVVQGLNPKVFDERVISDYQEVQRYLRTNGLFVPVLLSSIQGKPCYLNGRVWRAFEYIQNTGPGEINPEKAYNMAQTLRKFHDLMKNNDFQPQFKLDGFHDTPRVIKKLDECMHNPDYSEKAERVKSEYDAIRNNIESHYLPKGLKTTIIHGDPKQQNFLFNKNKVIALLDLDTMMQGSELLDLGDGFRAWAEQPDGGFNNEVFNASVQGYNSPNQKYDESLIMKSVGLINLELAARFLTDFFQESYFNWDSQKYSNSAEHNLARTKHQLKYYKNLSQEFAKRTHF